VRDFSVALKAGIASEVTTLGWLMSITRRDGTIGRYNTIGVDYTFGGQSFKAYPGFTMGAARFTDSLEAGSLAIGSAADSLGPITFTHAVAGLYSGARVRLYLIDYTTGEGSEIGWKWSIGNVTSLNNGGVTFDIWSAVRTNHALFLNKYQPGCTTRLFTTRCGVLKSAWEDSVTVVTYSSAFSFTISGVRTEGHTADWYMDGAIQFQDGENAGFAYDIRRSSYAPSVATITLRAPLRRPLTASTTAKIVPGCNLTTDANGCGRFSNYARYQGFEHLPDDQTQYGVEIVDDSGAPPVSQPPNDWDPFGTPSGWGSWG
jgi:uncharacterized phage protein (TIGR02218 family)